MSICETLCLSSTGVLWNNNVIVTVFHWLTYYVHLWNTVGAYIIHLPLMNCGTVTFVHLHLYCPQSLLTYTCTAHSHCILTPIVPQSLYTYTCSTHTVYVHLYCPVTVYLHMYCPQPLYTYTCTAQSLYTYTCTAQRLYTHTCTVHRHTHTHQYTCTAHTVYVHLYCPVPVYLHLCCPQSLYTYTCIAQSLYTYTCTASSHCILIPTLPTVTASILTAVPPVHCIILTPDQHSDRPVLVSAFHLTAVQPRVTAADRSDVVN